MWGGDKVLCLAAAIVLASCVQLPVSGPNHRAISVGASATLSSDDRVALDYVLLDISRTVLESTVNVGPEAFFGTFGSGKGPAPVIRIGVGDVVQISVFEASTGGSSFPRKLASGPATSSLCRPRQSIAREPSRFRLLAAFRQLAD